MTSGCASALRFAPRVGVGAAALLLATACSSGSTTPAAVGTTSPGGAASTTASAPATTSAPSTAASAPGAAPVGCGAGTAPTVSGSGPSDTAAAARQIADNYRKFFDPATPVAQKVGLVENGAAVASVLRGFAGNPLAAHASAAVLTVSFTSATAADVTFNLCESGAVVLPGSAGKSVLQTGVWKIADATLCGLVKLSGGGVAVAGCA
jgi:hypothetical protein